MDNERIAAPLVRVGVKPTDKYSVTREGHRRIQRHNDECQPEWLGIAATGGIHNTEPSLLLIGQLQSGALVTFALISQ